MPRRRRRDRERTPSRPLLWLEASLWLVGCLALTWVAATWLDGFVYQWRQGQRLEAALAGDPALPRETPGEAVAPSAPSLEPGAPIGRLVIPRLEVDVVVAHGADARTLGRAVGHLPGTALPAAGGNVVLAGHRDRHFRPLKDIQEGDDLDLVTPDGTFRYEVEWIGLVDPSEVWVLSSTLEPALTLVTCYPFNYVGPAPRRFVVRARQVAAEPATRGVELAAR